MYTKSGLRYISPKGDHAVTFATKAQGRDEYGTMMYEELGDVFRRNAQEISKYILKGYEFAGITENISC